MSNVTLTLQQGTPPSKNFILLDKMDESYMQHRFMVMISSIFQEQEAHH